MLCEPLLDGRSTTTLPVLAQRTPQGHDGLFDGFGCFGRGGPRSSKSECIRFVHSRGYPVLFFKSNACDSGCDLRGIIEVRQLIQPRSVCMEVPHHIANQIT